MHRIRHSRPRTYSSITIPDRVHPHARLVFALMKRYLVTYDRLEEMSGVRRASIKAWRRKNAPGLANLEACFNSLGWMYTPIPKAESLPPELAAAIAALAERFQIELPEIMSALVEIAARQQARIDRAA